MFTKTITLLSFIAISVNAIITPTSPDSNTVVKVGESINALWTIDSTDNWNNVEIQLMTGDNLQMVPLATVATGIDGTKVDSYSFDAPDVSPYSKIYFLQFTNGGDTTNVTWTTRFTIAGTDGSTTDPTNSTVYSGQTVQWGTGTLLSSVSTDGSSSNSTTSSTNSSTDATAGGSSASTNSVSDSSSASSTSTAESSTSTSASVSASASASGSKSSASASAASASSSTTSGAGKVQIGMGLIGVTSLLGLVLALE
ncbi:uncharacterized protein I206_103683 [Kwoniella pini CBS 10737]|uniref:Uncharacterized protein n=1 Tax=Kwoniella pini CBS 10737 TaxID=1296096 RepID=A0A1B9I980_9TREE|nr:uncharacterized protein I206_01317 [Kwoniella pini CBS 10737]OCF52033.1 hypothetical protein I206_01317 [Kwoniella pini CBS 10737]